MATATRQARAVSNTSRADIVWLDPPSVLSDVGRVKIVGVSMDAAPWVIAQWLPEHPV